MKEKWIDVSLVAMICFLGTNLLKQDGGDQAYRPK
jgi:hypothetical protein